ncbi:MAG: signal peptidase I [Burkholderiaceae bacterium]
MNFSLILFVLLIITGIFYALDCAVFRPGRRLAAERAVVEFQDRAQAMALTADQATIDSARHDLQEKHLRQPLWLEYTASFFPVILFVFLLRSFVVEPFKIPSSSMNPTLIIGDLILVNKFIYGIRLPVIDRKVIELSQPQRGDVIVFRFPNDPSIDYIKRLVGVPGDTVEYRNKRLYINGKAAAVKSLPDYFDNEKVMYSRQFQENLGEATHRILNDDEKPSYVARADNFPYREHCQYLTSGFICKVPAGHYFMMGDNRDHSSDSRYWGFVPDRNIVGKAFFIWMNFGQLSRVGSFN